MEKYCIFSAQYLPSFGGVEQYTYNLTNILVERGNQVIIITSSNNGLQYKEKQENGVEIYRIPSLNLMNGRLPLAYYSKTWVTLKRYLAKQKITRIIPIRQQAHRLIQILLILQLITIPTIITPIIPAIAPTIIPIQVIAPMPLQQMLLC